jgi:hypothetical protein
MKNNRPTRLSLKKLRDHITFLEKRHKLNIQWDVTYKENQYYDALTDTIYLYPISSVMDYLCSLHEIGHALTPAFKGVVKKYNEIDKLKFENFPSDPDEKIRLLKNLEKFVLMGKRLNEKIYSCEWECGNELIAWKYTFQNSLVWNKRCTFFCTSNILTYWHKHSKNSKINKETFTKKYISPIFE